MICLACGLGKLIPGPICNHCGECIHLCKGKCPILTRIRKQKEVETERSRKYYIKDEPVKAIKKPNGKWVPEYLGL